MDTVGISDNKNYIELNIQGVSKKSVHFCLCYFSAPKTTRVKSKDTVIIPCPCRIYTVDIQIVISFLGENKSEISTKH